MVRPGSTSNLIIQAPHRFHDEHTLPIAWQLFARTKALALYVNTVHRYRGSEPDNDGNHPADVAHNQDSLFHAATLGAIDAVRNVDLVQIHGFDDREETADYAAVVSAGERKRGLRHVQETRERLERALGQTVLRFPDDTSKLGATTNVQGMAVRAHDGRFLHVELSTKVRARCSRNASTTATLVDEIARALEKP